MSTNYKIEQNATEDIVSSTENIVLRNIRPRSQYCTGTGTVYYTISKDTSVCFCIFFLQITRETATVITLINDKSILHQYPWIEVIQFILRIIRQIFHYSSQDRIFLTKYKFLFPSTGIIFKISITRYRYHQVGFSTRGVTATF